MTAGQNGSSNGGGRPLWVAGLSPPDSWRSLRQPGNPQLHQVRHPQHRVWGHESKPEVSNFRLAKVSNFRLGLTKQKRRRTGSLREKSGRKPGGQKGHEGETLRQVAVSVIKTNGTVERVS